MSALPNTYPKYIRYSVANRHPSVLDQVFPVLGDIPENKRFYPRNLFFERFFSESADSQRFGACCFSGFLHDTIAVEHDLVIPAIAALRYLPLHVPDGPMEDLFLLVADEGHHAAQAAIFLNSIADRFRIRYRETDEALPAFLQRLNDIKGGLSNDNQRRLADVIAGVVTETRVSIELGQFSRDEQLLDEVREVCRSHQEDEAIHSSQFRALGAWMWRNLGEADRDLVAELFAKILVLRSLPDVQRLAFYLAQVTGMASERCRQLVTSAYSPEALQAEMLIAARPTLRYLRTLGVTELHRFRMAYENFDYAAYADGSRVAA
jgi:Rad3-related DNA helicase